MRKVLSVAIPWNISDDMSLGGFHPRYRILFETVPRRIQLCAWDWVKLQHHLKSDRYLQPWFLQQMQKLNTSQEKALFFTELLPGAIEFHHTRPLASLKRPFIFHATDTVFLDNTSCGVQEHYKRMFAHPYCIGIFVSQTETIAQFSQYFKQKDIDEKLMLYTMREHAPQTHSKSFNPMSLTTPRFLFVHSTDQGADNFFSRGGHYVLQFWKAFLCSGRVGQLVLRCIKPSDEVLLEHGVDVAFVRYESQRSIQWIEGYLSGKALNCLYGGSHFFLLLSTHRHMYSVMHAMSLGTIPVLFDRKNPSLPRQGIVWIEEGAAIKSMMHQIGIILDRPKQYLALQQAAYSSRIKPTDNQDFWEMVEACYGRYICSQPHKYIQKIPRAIKKCMVSKQDWGRIFDSPSQPMCKINTGKYQVYAWSGIYYIDKENTGTKPPLSFLDREQNEKHISCAYTVSGLEGHYLFTEVPPVFHRILRLGSFILRPFPRIRRVFKNVLHHYLKQSDKSLDVNNE